MLYKLHHHVKEKKKKKKADSEAANILLRQLAYIVNDSIHTHVTNF